MLLFLSRLFKVPLFERIYKDGKVTNEPITGQTVYDVVTRRYKEVGLSRLTPHDLRKTYATNLLENGVYGDKLYVGSGKNVSQLLLQAFTKHSINVESGNDYQSFNEAMAFAKSKGYGYLIVPTILEWEDRATECSGIPDKVSIKVVIVILK
jgi:integrase